MQKSIIVTGEAIPMLNNLETKFCRRKTYRKVIEMEVYMLFPKLSDAIMEVCVPKKCRAKHKTITDSISRYFTPILLIAFAGFGY
jgi:Cu+-exporting ATPase